MSEPIVSLQRACEVLQVSLQATPKTASAAYRRLAAEYHPDRVAHLAPELQTLARQRMAEINEAYDFVKVHLPAVIPDKPAANADPTAYKDKASGGNSSGSETADASRPAKEKEPEQKIAFACPHCERRITVPESLRGKDGNCTGCKQMITVPTHMELRCNHCGKKNRLPNNLKKQRAICRKCYSSLADATQLRS